MCIRDRAGVERQPGDLDRHGGLGGLVVVVEVVGQVVVRLLAHGCFTPSPSTTAAVTASAAITAATSCTRNIDAPRSSASTLVAIVPGKRPDSGRPPASLPRKLLREVPTTSGRPIATSSSRRRSSSRLWSTVLPNPIPGSCLLY